MRNTSRFDSLIIFLVLGVFSLVGCTTLREKATETAKVMWGSSVKALEESRTQANSKTFQCALDECLRQVVSISKEESVKIFINNPKKGFIVVMGLPNTIDTTEVGIFFTAIEAVKTKIEITSLSPYAQEIAADLFFSKLKMTFSETQ